MPTIHITDTRITHPGQLSGWPYLNPADGLGFAGPVDVLVEDCEIDFSGLSLEEQDEAVSLTWGAGATFRRCHIRGAGKLFLCGSGDPDKADAEKGRGIRLESCILEDFCRRGPEVQAGMELVMVSCLVSFWGNPVRFNWSNPWKDRAFGTWAHGGGKVWAYNCIFSQPYFCRNLKFMCYDLLVHIGQAVKDEGAWALLRPSTYLPGICRGLTAGPGGYVEACGCWKDKWWIRLENHRNSMSRSDALALLSALEEMRKRVETSVR